MNSVDDWVAEEKAKPGAERIGMFLTHRGIVRGTSRSGTSVRGMTLLCDRRRLDEALAAARALPGVVAVRVWVNEGDLLVGDDIMQVMVAGDIREHVFAALQQLVSSLKTDVLTESETT